MQQKKKPREVRHCPHHGNQLLKRRGRATKKWLWYCPRPQCSHKEYINGEA